MEALRALHSELPEALRHGFVDDPERRALREDFRALRERLSQEEA
jgi:hypothetical protein